MVAKGVKTLDISLFMSMNHTKNVSITSLLNQTGNRVIPSPSRPRNQRQDHPTPPYSQPNATLHCMPCTRAQLAYLPWRYHKVQEDGLGMDAHFQNLSLQSLSWRTRNFLYFFLLALIDLLPGPSGRLPNPSC